MAKKLYYDNGKEKVGPISGDELLRLREQGALPADTWVRREDSGTWRPLNSVDLRAEEEEARNPSLLSVLVKSGMLTPLLIMLAALAIFVFLVIGAVQFFWPVLLVVFIVWILSKALKE